MENIFVFIIYPITLFVSYFIGRYSMGSSEIENAIKKAKKTLNPSKGIIIPYPTAEEIEYEQSGEKKVDEAREKVFKEQFDV